MAMRVTQRQMYSNFLFNMNNNLSAYMSSHEQSSSQKKVNRPSDDPYGSSQIMASYKQLNSIAQYKDNLSMAKGWLTAGESALAQVQDQLTSVISLLQQGASGTYNGDNREGIGGELREILEQLISYSNTKFNGRYIFGGHKTDVSPYEMSLGAHTRDAALAGVGFEVTGDVAKTAIVQFTDTDDLANHPSFRYSLDNGETWVNGTWAPGTDHIMECGTDINIKLHNAAGVTASEVTDLTSANETGTWLYVRPAVEYKGDTNDPTVVQTYPYSTTINTSASGVFKRDVSVRIDNIIPGVPPTIEYAYSTDDGTSWTSGTAPQSTPTKLPVAGGFLTINSGTPAPGDQFIIRPHRADIDLTIGSNASITINNVGADIFGGLYSEPFSTDGAQPYPDDVSKNLFELMGMAIAYGETGTQNGFQEVLDKVLEVDAHIGLARATIGSRLNRVESVGFQLDSLKIDESDRLSSLEDVDLTELMVRLSQQELAYKSVLQSSSMIMQLSLMNFI